MNSWNRRNFLKTSLAGCLAAACSPASGIFASSALQEAGRTRVALTTGNNRADIAFRSLLPFSDLLKQSIGNKMVILKPNNVSVNVQLASTHADTLEGILEFLRSINKLTNAVIAESAAGGPTFEGFSNFGYNRLAEKYNVRLVDLDREKSDVVHVFDEKDFRPHPVRVSSMLLDPGSFIVSVARMKTHDRVIATLSLKNIVLGAPVKDAGFTYGPGRKPGARNDKPIVHGSGIRGINYNIFALAGRLHPHLAVIDGFEGMEGNGPGNGTPVDHRICVASTDWLAADRVGIELMGIDFSKVGYLNYCSQANMGTASLESIEVLGERISGHRRKYRLHDNYNSQLEWMKPVNT
ncbi:MAG TPA: DUF362 domain-containing protein [Bacteroidales bacterium]|nr:DUF362 domain-containing protein [Bacteroidales bacterium]